MTVALTNLRQGQLYWARIKIHPGMVNSAHRAEAAGFNFNPPWWIGTAPLYVVNGITYRVVLPNDTFRVSRFHESPSITDIDIHRLTHGYLTINREDVLEVHGYCDVATLHPVEDVAVTTPETPTEFDLPGYQTRVRERLIHQSNRRRWSTRELDELLTDVGLEPSHRSYLVTATFVQTMTFDVPAASEQAAMDHIRNNVNGSATGTPVNYDHPVTNTREIQSITAR